MIIVSRILEMQGIYWYSRGSSGRGVDNDGFRLFRWLLRKL